MLPAVSRTVLVPARRFTVTDRLVHAAQVDVFGNDRLAETTVPFTSRRRGAAALADA